MIADIDPASESPHADSALERLARCLIAQTIDSRRDHVDVAVVDGLATVTGEVATTTRRCDVERHIRSLAGVQGVTNRIVVVPNPLIL